MAKFLSRRAPVAILLVMVLIASSIAFAVPASAKADIKVPEKKYDIALVFDNSGSMYVDDNDKGIKAWCRAKYAMEIFASMLDYSKDKLGVYPMWGVTTDGKTKTGNGTIDRVEIASKEDIDKIHNFYTIKPLGTPFEPAVKAYDYLKGSQADEKWLIFLTDGEITQDKSDPSEAGSTRDAGWLRNNLLKFSSEKIKVQYLGIGAAANLAEDSEKFFYAKKSNETSLNQDLIEICNRIFSRDPLSEKYIKGKNLDLRISMKKLIAFVQGKGAKINSLKSADGKDIPIVMDSGQRTFSKLSNGLYSQATVDDTLAGQVVTFDACEAGEYTLDYSGSDIQIFYEPDIDISFELRNADGPIDLETTKISAGDYKFNYKLVDSVTGEDVTSSDLLGNVDLKSEMVDSKGKSTPLQNGGDITLSPDADTYFKITGTYMRDHEITTEDNPAAYTFEIVMPDVADELKISLDVKQNGNWYVQHKHDSWEPIIAHITHNGKDLSDEQLSSLETTFEFSPEIKYTAKPIPGESSYEIRICQDEKGEFVKPENGNYLVRAKTLMRDEYDREITAEANSGFEIRPYSKFWRWLKIIILLLIILALITFILTRKALPHKMWLVINRSDSDDYEPGQKVNIPVKAKGLRIVPLLDYVTCDIKKESRLYQKFSPNSYVSATNFNLVGVESVSVNGRECRSRDEDEAEQEPVLITNGTPIDVTFEDGESLQGYIKINR